MFKMIYKTSFLYYVLAFMLLFKCIDFDMLHALRLSLLMNYLRSPRIEYKIVLFDYLVHLNPKDYILWFKLAQNERLWGDYSNAISAYKNAILLNPREKSYQDALSYCYQLQRNNLRK